MNVLIAEDDEVLGTAIVKGLCENRHNCHWIKSGREVVPYCRANPCDVVVLDLMLPDQHGFAVLDEIRESKLDVAVLILTAMGAVEDKVHGLNSGADDYLVKPFAFAELLARLAAIERRHSKTPATILQAGSLRIELTSRLVKRGDKEIELTPTEYKLLEYLMRNVNQVVTRRMLCEHLWESDWEGVTNVIEVHINRLRGKLNKGFDRDIIHTVRGSGYELRPDG